MSIGYLERGSRVMQGYIWMYSVSGFRVSFLGIAIRRLIVYWGHIGVP